MRKTLAACLFVAFNLFPLAATNLFVAKTGNDANDGTSKEKAFLSIQKGVDALQPGDALMIGPGEYHESVRRDGVGSLDAETVIRAVIPGTVVLRGDVPAPAFKKLDGTRFTYVADFDHDGPVVAVNELDTLTIFPSKPNRAEVEYAPGTFHFDQEKRKLYISTSDMQPVGAHAYSVSTIPTHGFYLKNAKRVVVEDLAVTGFNGLELLNYRSRTSGTVWGLFLAFGKKCEVRGCRAWLNGGGIGFNSMQKENGDNVIEDCAAWGNNAAFKSGDVGGISGFKVRRDQIINCASFLNGGYGINFYGTGTDGGVYGEWKVPGNEPENKSRIVENLMWGNGTDVKIKTGVKYFHTVERCGWLGTWSIKTDPIHCLVGKSRDHQSVPADNIDLVRVENLHMGAEFADPDNHDYRLQATSRFRKTAPDGSDQGPHPYQPNVFYVKPDGDDAADGLSMKHAWKTLVRGIKNLKPGDTLYLSPGTYQGGVTLKASGEEKNTIRVRGRGFDPTVVKGGLKFENASAVDVERILFDGPVTVKDGDNLRLANCALTAPKTALTAISVTGLQLEHCLFTGFADAAVALKKCENVDLRGDLFDNENGVAVKMDGATSVSYSNYNVYANPAAVWCVSGTKRSLIDLRPQFAANSVARKPRISLIDGVPTLTNPTDFVGLGPYATRVGPFRFEDYKAEFHLTLEPVVHSVSATTANIEWMTSLPVGCQVAWGDTPECENSTWYDVNHFGTYSLTGLEPGKTYYFKIKAFRGPSAFRQIIDIHPDPELITRLDGEPLAFTTLKTDPAPKSYHVANDGDDGNDGLSRKTAWRTIRHAASKVNVGDTVLVAGGFYEETIRIRATGAENAPITFKNAPGETARIDGAGEKLTHGFIVGGKSHLRFDGFHFKAFNMETNTPHKIPYFWAPIRSAEFNLYQCDDIQISRCLSDGRLGYSATFLMACQTKNLVIENCVFINKMGGALNFFRCPNVVVRNNVFLRPMIGTFSLNNAPGQILDCHDNIFCGMMHKKAACNASYAELEELSSLKLKNNCFMIRALPPEKRVAFCEVDHAKRKVTSEITFDKLDETFGDTRTLLADPVLTGVVELLEKGEKTRDYPPEMLLKRELQLDFDDFFATNPEVVKRGMGLQPEAFKEFDCSNKEKKIRAKD